MKITRQKHAKKHLGFFRNNFGVREPYQILLDGTFCQAALRGRIQLRDQLPRYLMGETQLCTTRWACGAGSRVWPSVTGRSGGRYCALPIVPQNACFVAGRPGFDSWVISGMK